MAEFISNSAISPWIRPNSVLTAALRTVSGSRTMAEFRTKSASWASRLI